MTEDKGLMFAGEALIALVEGINGAMNHGTWRDDKGMRLNDTNEWALFYTVFCSRRRLPQPPDTISEGDLWNKIWAAYWQDEPHGTTAALERVVHVVREHDTSKGALASASSGLISHVRSSEGVVSEIAGEGPAASTTNSTEWQPPMTETLMPCPHPDDLAVDRFAAIMKAKLAFKREQGYGGWDDPEDCTLGWLSKLLRKHVDKGDPVDVGNFAMMIHQRGGIIE